MSATTLAYTLELFYESPYVGLILLLGLHVVSYPVYYRHLHPLSGYTGPLLCSLTDFHEIWGEDHETFDPERWNDEKRAKGLETLVTPYSVGKRSCVGQNLANANILKMITTLLKCYEFEFVNKDEPIVIVSHGDSDLRTPVMVRVRMRGKPYEGAVPER